MRAFLLAATLAVASSRSLAQQCSDPEQARLRELDRTWADATTCGDRVRLEAIRRALFTGTRVKHDGRWMVRAFQGTAIP